MATVLPTLPSRTFQQFVSDMIASWASSTGVTPQLLDGDPLLAFFQACASQDVFIESVILALIALTRAQTSTGGDLDTWMAQFNFPRLPADYAEGPLTVGVLSAHASSTPLPVGTLVQTPGGAITYQVIADTTQSAYNATLGAYILAAGATSMTVSAQAQVAGAGSNVQANQLTTFPNPVAGIDTVTNAAAITDGTNSETDAAYRARFVLYLSALARATLSAIETAIESVQQGLDYLVLDNTNVNGDQAFGQFTVVLDNGTGSPPSSLLNAVSAAIGAVAGFTIQYNVIAPVLDTIAIVLNVAIASGSVSGTVTAAVQAAIVAYVNSLPIGQELLLSELVTTAQGVAGVASVELSSVTIAGSAANYTPVSTGVVRTTTSDVTIGTYSG